MRIRILLGALSVGLAAGCSPAIEPVEVNLPPTLLPPTLSPAPRSVPLEGSVVFARTGGIAGISEQWSLFADGRVVNTQGDEFQVDASEIVALVDAMEGMGFYGWRVEVPRRNTCADCFTYSIRASYKGQSNQVDFVDAQLGVPDGVWTLLDRIQVILSEAAEG